MIQCWRTWHSEVYTCFIPQCSCYHIPVMWGVVVVIQSAIHWHPWVDFHPSIKHTWSCWSFCQWRCPCLLHITWILHPSSVDTLADVHISHSFLFIHPREVFLAWCWVITRPLSSYCIISLSLPLAVGLTGVGLVCLSHTWQTPMPKGVPTSDTMRRSQLQCRVHKCPCWSFTSYEGMSVTIWHNTSWVLSSYLYLIFLFPWKASALTRTRLPGFKPTVPTFQL